MSVEIDIYDFMKECIGLNLREIEEYMTFNYKHLSEMDEDIKCNMNIMEFVKLCEKIDRDKIQEYSYAAKLVIAANKFHSDLVGNSVALFTTRAIRTLNDKVKYIAKKRSKLFNKKQAYIKKVDVENMKLVFGGNADVETLMVAIIGNNQREVDTVEDRKVLTTINEHAKKMYVLTNIKHLLMKEEKEFLNVEETIKDIKEAMYKTREFELTENHLTEAEFIYETLGSIRDIENDRDNYIKLIRDRAISNELDAEKEVERWLEDFEVVKEKHVGNKLKPKLKTIEIAFNKLNNIK